jgi:uncharacterized protein YacL
MIRRIIRGGITLLGAAFGYGVYLLFLYIASQVKVLAVIDHWATYQKSILAIACALIFGFLFFILTPAFSKISSRVAHGVENEIRHLTWQDLLTGTIGLITGLIIASLISLAFTGIGNSYIRVLSTIVTYIIFIWLGVVVGGRRGKEVLRNVLSARRSLIAGRSGKSRTGSGATPKILDTSVIIDGRIADIMKTGFIEGNIVIPEFVLVELRHIADSSDSLKRNRGRRGLDILNRIQTEYGIQIYNTDSEKALDDIPEVDVKLLKLAQIMNGKVVTNDFNLNKVALIKGVEVLNINELANMLKPVVLPGEEMTLFLVKEGKEQGQAVAYLDDGTMIVVEDGRRYIGKTIDVVVSSVLQTSAGRMIFARTKHGA